MKLLRLFISVILCITPLLTFSAEDSGTFDIIERSTIQILADDMVPRTTMALTGNYALACQTGLRTYYANMDNYIYSPVITLPQGLVISLDFSIRGYFDDPDAIPDVDYWGCEVSPDNGVHWFAVSNPYGDPDGSNYVYSDAPESWASFSTAYGIEIRLDDYAGGDVQLRWYFHSDDDEPVGEGIFIDDVTIVIDGYTAFSDDFETGELGEWESYDITAPMWHQTTRHAYEGNSWAMNDPHIGEYGGYYDHQYMTLDSPPVKLPADSTNTLTFYQDYAVEEPSADDDYDGWDGVNVRISNDGGDSWTVLRDPVPAYNATSLYSFGAEFNEGPGIPGWGGSSNGWHPVSFIIPSDYDGQEVVIRWAFAADPYVSTSSDSSWFGWVIDDINIAGVLLNDGEDNDGWEISSMEPVGGDLWHLSFEGDLPAPQNLSVVNGDNVVRIAWDAPPAGDGGSVLSYNIYRRDAGSNNYNSIGQNITNLYYYDTDVLKGNEYFYVVSACYAIGEGLVSEEISAMPVSPTLSELVYDDNTAEAGFNLGPGGNLAVKFTPVSYPTYIKNFQVYVHTPDTGDVHIQILDDDGVDGLPASLYSEFDWTMNGPGWNTYEFGTDTLWISSGSFYISLLEDATTPSIGIDTDGPFTERSYYDAGSGWDNLANIGLEYNLMIHAVVERELPVEVNDEDIVNFAPHAFMLSENYPNPFNPETTIAYELPVSGRVELNVYDISGRKVSSLVNTYQEAGRYEVYINASTWDSGVYLYVLESGNVRLTEKMIVLK